jgi:C_GCAxxG_C_C family probable redox protein
MKKASQIHDLGYNCAQAVVCALNDVTGFNEETSYALAGGLGGGMRAAEVCGAVSGAILALGMAFPYTDCTDTASKDKIAAITREFHRRFKEQNKSIICRELLGYDVEIEGFRPEINKNICPSLIDGAVQIVRELLAEHKKS